MKIISINDSSHGDIPKIVVFLFLLIMAAHLSGLLWIKCYQTILTDGWIIGRVDHFTNLRMINWDDMIYIPKINAFANGDLFTDPWNAINKDWIGWGTFSLVAPAIGGILKNIFGENHFFSLSIWGMFNFFSMGAILYVFFRKGLFRFSRIISVFSVFIFLSYPWLGAMELWEPQNFIRSVVFGEVMCALTRIECGLFTYLFYVAFLWIYWRWIEKTTSKNSVYLGGAVALLSYVYTFHFMFAFLLVATRGLLFLYLRNWQKVKMVLLFGFVTTMVMIPFLVNSYFFNNAFSGNLFMERLDYSVGRIPSLEEYGYLRNLLLPICLGGIYFFVGQRSKNKKILLTELLILTLAFVFLLHIRVVFGFMQATDHFWRYSLALPSTLWCVLVLADMSRLLTTRVKFLRIFLGCIALFLPILIVGRAYFYTYSPSRVQNDMAQWVGKMSSGQKQVLNLMNSLTGVVKSGDGFVSTEVDVSYHIMINFGARPFAANGISPLSPEKLTERYLAANYLSGIDSTEVVLTRMNRKKGGFFPEHDKQVYLYVNLIHHDHLPQYRKEHIASMYQEDYKKFYDSAKKAGDLDGVRFVIVDKNNLKKARKRILSCFVIDKELTVEEWVVFKVHGELL